jgi:hypothetical protein
MMETERSEPGNLIDTGGHDHADEILIDANNMLISADKVVGSPVYTDKRERLGSIEPLMIDKCSRTIAYVLMSLGGFLEIGARFHPFPWDRISYDTALEGYDIDLDLDALLRAPPFDSGEIPFLTKDRREELADFYGSPRG